MIQPKNLLQIEGWDFRYFSISYLIQFSVPVGREQAFGGGKQCAHAVTFDRASFKNEVQAVDILTSQSSGFYGLSGDQIVQLGGKFSIPSH